MMNGEQGSERARCDLPAARHYEAYNRSAPRKETNPCSTSCCCFVSQLFWRPFLLPVSTPQMRDRPRGQRCTGYASTICIPESIWMWFTASENSTCRIVSQSWIIFFAIIARAM